MRAKSVSRRHKSPVVVSKALYGFKGESIISALEPNVYEALP